MRENKDSQITKMNEETNNHGNLSGKDTGFLDRTQNDNDLENENLLVNIKQESQDHLSENDGGGGQEEADQESTHMSPVETATLLLLSRIALFNKVKPLFV